MGLVLDLIHLVIRVAVWLIIIDAILTWIPSIDPRHPLVRLLRNITRPILEPFRQILPPERTGNMDFSPLIAIIVLNIIDRIIV